MLDVIKLTVGNIVKMSSGKYEGIKGIVTNISLRNITNKYVRFDVILFNDVKLTDILREDAILVDAKKNYSWKSGDLDKWLLDLERITQNGREIVTEKVLQLLARYKGKDVFATEFEDETAISIFVFDEFSIIHLINLTYDKINEPEIVIENIIDDVIKEIKKDITTNDYTAIAELLKFIPLKNLKAFLPE